MTFAAAAITSSENPVVSPVIYPTTSFHVEQRLVISCLCIRSQRTDPSVIELTASSQPPATNPKPASSLQAMSGALSTVAICAQPGDSQSTSTFHMCPTTPNYEPLFVLGK